MDVSNNMGVSSKKKLNKNCIVVAVTFIVLIALTFTAHIVNNIQKPLVTAYTMLFSHELRGDGHYYEMQWIPPEAVYETPDGKESVFIIRDRVNDFGDIEYYLEELKLNFADPLDNGMIWIPSLPNLHTSNLVIHANQPLNDGAVVRWANRGEKIDISHSSIVFDLVKELFAKYDYHLQSVAWLYKAGKYSVLTTYADGSSHEEPVIFNDAGPVGIASVGGGDAGTDVGDAVHSVPNTGAGGGSGSAAGGNRPPPGAWGSLRPWEIIGGAESVSDQRLALAQRFNSDRSAPGSGDDSHFGLSLYIDNNDDEMKIALGIFKRLYPDVEVNVMEPVGGRFDPGLPLERQALYTLLMAGKGPDILSTYYMDDVDIMARNGVFADMGAYYDADPETSAGLNALVMDAGVFNGKRFLFPLSWYPAVLLTAEELLEDLGISSDEIQTYGGFLAATGRGIEQFSFPFTASRLAGGEAPEDIRVILMQNTLRFSGLPVVDWETRRADLSAQEIRQTVEWVKIIVGAVEEGSLSATDIDDASNRASKGQALFHDYGNLQAFRPQTIGVHTRLYVRNGYMPLQMGLPSVTGGTVANVQSAVGVRANSPNLENAYNFIRIMLSMEVQDSILLAGNFGTYVPVRVDAYEVIFRGLEQFSMISGSAFANIWPGWPYRRQEFDAYIELFETVDSVKWSEKWAELLTAELMPYIEGDLSYEECIRNARRRIEIYLSEL